MGDSADGITQERYFYFWFTAFWKSLHRETPLLQDHGWCQDSLEQLRQGQHVTAAYNMGFRGYCLGTKDILVDLLGITDPLLARMPHNPSDKNWRPGHYRRLIPAGYCSSLAQGRNALVDLDAASYYDALRLITTSEPLFSRARLLAIWQMNTGQYSAQLGRIQQSLIDDMQHGGAMQTQATDDCPIIELPAEVIERLKVVQ
jgi:arabinofuranosyltransferase